MIVRGFIRRGSQGQQEKEKPFFDVLHGKSQAFRICLKECIHLLSGHTVDTWNVGYQSSGRFLQLRWHPDKNPDKLEVTLC